MSAITAQSTALREVRLYGALGKKFGRSHRFNVQSPAEAIAALKANYPAFEEHMVVHSKPGYHVFVDEANLGANDLATPTARGTIKIVPVIAGRGKGGLQILLGAALIAASFYVPGTLAIAGVKASAVTMSLGLGLVFGGVAQMLTKSPSMTSLERPDNRPSYAFNGPVNTTQPGNPVPICYGRMIVGSQVVHAGISTDEIPVDWNTTPEQPSTGSIGV
ncbi:tail assembly protein [Cupriavidus neocaledonicus]|uniref:Tail assembly protein n=1 Tax=Cupriavidus neocaledonicus TaxID=1040979 RepID=A0A375H3X0_9BURK|nr:tail assembly protein [Cupriavidus neocaledonicus]SPD45596.1 conserved protein of unknown function [Cupriavidus neocaledonicus]